MLKFI